MYTCLDNRFDHISHRGPINSTLVQLTSHRRNIRSEIAHRMSPRTFPPPEEMEARSTVHQHPLPHSVINHQRTTTHCSSIHTYKLGCVWAAVFEKCTPVGRKQRVSRTRTLSQTLTARSVLEPTYKSSQKHPPGDSPPHESAHVASAGGEGGTSRHCIETAWSLHLSVSNITLTLPVSVTHQLNSVGTAVAV